MDDLILAGALAIIALMELNNAVAAYDSVRVAAILGIVLLFLAAYAGCGLWLQKSGRI